MGDADCIRRVADILVGEPVARQAVVVSAMAKTTDALLGLVAAAEQAAADVPARIEAIVTRYRSTVAALLRDKARSSQLLATFDADIADVRDVLRAITLVRQAGERSRDLVSGYGELWSSRLLAAHLAERATADRPVHWVDARDLIVIERVREKRADRRRKQTGSRIEDKFGLSIPDDALKDVDTVASVARAIEVRLQREGRLEG